MGEYERKDRAPERLSEPENDGGLREAADEVREGDQRPLQEGEPADGPDVEDLRDQRGSDADEDARE